MISDRDAFSNIDLSQGLTDREAELVQQTYAAAHRDGYTARAQHDLVDLYEIADGADAESRHAAIRRIVDRGRAA